MGYEIDGREQLPQQNINKSFFEKSKQPQTGSETSTIEKNEVELEKQSEQTALSNLPDAAIIVANKIHSNVFEKNIFIRFCTVMNCNGLASEDILNNHSFIEGISSTCKLIMEFEKCHKTLNASHSRENKTTALYQSIVKTKEMLSQLQVKMKKASIIKANPHQGLDSMMSSMQEKASKFGRSRFSKPWLFAFTIGIHVTDSIRIS